MSEKMDFIDLVIQAILDHEKKLDSQIQRLEELINKLERGETDVKRKGKH